MGLPPGAGARGAGLLPFLCEHLPRVTARYGEQGLLEHRHAHYVKHPDKTHDLTYMRKHWLAEIAQQFGYGAELVEPGFQVFWEGRNTVELFEGVEACLHALQGRFKIGAITNGNADVEYIGIGRYFDFVITSADAGASKPAAAIFEAALDAAEVEAASAVHVGDDPQRDVLGAAAVGMRTIWFNPLCSLGQVARSPMRWCATCATSPRS